MNVNLNPNPANAAMMRRIGELLPSSTAEQPIDCHTTNELVSELICRALNTNGLDFTSTPEKLQLAQLLLNNIVEGA